MKVCLVEPYYGGSHRTLIDMLHARYANSEMFTMRAKKWHWRLRSSALTFSQQIPMNAKYDVLFVSSMVNLADLLVLRTDLKAIPNIIVYFHENQLEYPKQQDNSDVQQEDRDHYFVHANIMSCLVATQVLFNSQFNMESFLTKIPAFLNHLPMEQSCRPDHKRICNEIRAKSKVVFMLIESVALKTPRVEQPSQVLRIGFPHRWEHDKDPAMFLRVLKRLQDKQIKFTLRVFGGEEYADVSIRKDIESVLGNAQDEYLEHCGRLESREDYLQSLSECNVVVSTAQHEFFGVSMVEACLLGCLVLCPNRLAYPELFRRDALYNTEAQLFKALQSLCLRKRTQQQQQLLPGVEARVDINAVGGEEFDRCFHVQQANKLQRLE